MLRVTQIKLPLDHPADALTRAVLTRLGIEAHELLDVSVVRRSYDARKRNAIVWIYSVDVRTTAEARVLAGRRRDVRVAPDTTYRQVATAPPELHGRPVVVDGLAGGRPGVSQAPGPGEVQRVEQRMQARGSGLVERNVLPHRGHVTRWSGSGASASSSGSGMGHGSDGRLGMLIL